MRFTLLFLFISSLASAGALCPPWNCNAESECYDAVNCGPRPQYPIYPTPAPAAKSPPARCTGGEEQCLNKGFGNTCTIPWLDGQTAQGTCEPVSFTSADCECAPVNP